ncbi:MAG: DEAD/DEAH box helicase family protein [Candidatus Omnitrophica bacterium]|nr:DEAD/DEAH box helicase family protein [Candidatus Omnitrophota bacterium]
MKIEKYLILNKYLLSLFGVNDIKHLLNELKNKSEGVDSDGRGYFVNALRGIENLKISEDTLLRYDENIQSYVKKINFRREPVSLKYFQYLAVLFTEIVLDNLKNKKFEFLYELNKFLSEYKQEQDIQILGEFTENNLRKLAFWMATGSGKTLIMHINYYQFFNYKLFSPDNILLITPNEGLSKQHFEELQKSGIPCNLYSGSLNGGLRSENEILVIEMTKFVEEKKGAGVTLPVDTFEGRDLVFVDEGHKGKKSEEQKWAKLRNKLAGNTPYSSMRGDGFVFEYSATFGQILSESEEEILEEYAKSIVFDYSYKYFYLDGYGKDFNVLNVKHPGPTGHPSTRGEHPVCSRRHPSTRGEWEQEFQEGMFVANLLSFYEQILVYEKNKELAKEYNIEKPLWIFVGTTVTGKEEESDVIQIVEFIKRVIDDEDWVNGWVNKIMNGKTNLKDEEGKDVFKDRFKYLRKNPIDFDDLYRRIFGGRGSFGSYVLRNAEGEIGLKVGENEYFGVINIGDVSGLKKQLEKKGILVEEDAISGSLFDDIKKESSKINILIGSKKFIEGWDTWRVSSMGLLNIGKGQGPQIIQLFGRGVRLKGKGMSLKRSGENLQIKLLETLNIYGIKADYLNKFLDAIRKEEVEFETIEIPVQFQHEEKWETLYTLSKPENKFEEKKILKLEIDDRIYITVDLLPKISIYLAKERKEEGIKAEKIKSVVQDQRDKLKEKIDLLDWERIYKEIVEFKVQRNYWNFVFDKETLKKIILSDKYSIFSLPEIFEIKEDKDITYLENIALLVIKKYIDLFYRKNAKRFETENLRFYKVEHPPLPFISERRQGYILQINKKNKKLIDEIRKLVKDLKGLIKKEDTETLPRIYFDGSLYVPLLLKSKKIDKISPEGLVKSEEDFVRGLREYLKLNKKKFKNYEIYLLRNLPKSGIGFQLEWSGFYPDFIMWVKKGEYQTIVFIDPHGLEHTRTLNNEKIIFAGFKPQQEENLITIKDIEKRLDKNLSLESFILSPTKYEDLKEGETNFPSKEEFINHHVLFLEDSDWCEKLFKKIASRYNGKT